MANHIITALSIQKNNPKRVNVYLDGEFAFGLTRIVAAWLEVDQVISDEKIAQLKQDDDHEIAYQRALRLLKTRMRSEAEIRTDLVHHSVSSDSINLVLNRLRNSGLLDDSRFAQIWIENRVERRPRSRRALNYELLKRGISPETIEESLKDIDDQVMAYKAATKQSRKLDKLDWSDFSHKMYTFLTQRGFSYEIILQVIPHVWSEMKQNEIIT